jgi:hypothetical protein
MAATREKTALGLQFEVTAPLAMGLSKGEAGLLRGSKELSPTLSFTICQPQFPIRQDIWLVPKDEKRDPTKRIAFEFDRKTWRRLTPDIKGSLSFVTRGLPIREEVSVRPLRP